MTRQLKYFSILFGLLVLVLGTVQAAEITVDADGVCTLAEAIDSANNNNANGNGCVDGVENETDVISLETNVFLNATLPEFYSDITIKGHGYTIDGGGLGGTAVLTVWFDSNVFIREVTITGGDEGGIKNLGTLTLLNSTVSGNNTLDSGGGIDNFWGVLTVINSTVSGNSARYGGGVNSEGGLTILVNTLVSENFATKGGGIFGGDDIVLKNSIISGNIASIGNEIYGEVLADAFNVLGEASNTSAAAFYRFEPGDNDVIATSDGLGVPLHFIFDPTLANNGGPTKTHALVAGSPAIDLDAECSALMEEEEELRDQRGFFRPIGGGCDAGAFEFGSSKMIVDASGTCTLADAITAANTDTATGGCPAGSGGDTIVLEIDVTLEVPLPEIVTPITIEGQGHTIDGNGGDWSVLTIVEDGNMTLNETTVTGADHISNVVAQSGGGIRNYYGTVTLNRSTVSGNSGSFSGGISNFNGTATLNNSTVSDNFAENYAGGVTNYDGVMNLTNSTVSDNFSAGQAGGIANNGSLTLINSTVSGNSASTFAGGIYNIDTMIVSSSIISGNIAATDEGREIYNQLASNGIVTVNSYNLFGHSGITDAQAIAGFTPGFNDTTATSDGTNPTALSNILGPLADNGGPTKTHALVPGSPAIDLDVTCSNGLIQEDQRGEHRPFGAGCDAGAYELKAIIVDVEENCTLADAITAANTDTATGGCPAGFESDTIILDTDVTLATELPEISSQITIEGQKHTINGSSGENGEWSVLMIFPEGNLTLNEASITGGMFVDGGGIFNAGITTLNRCTVYGNWTSRLGGGIVSRGTLILVDSTVRENGAGVEGGGIFINEGDVTLINSTVSGNGGKLMASTGGISNGGGELILINSTVAGNDSVGISSRTPGVTTLYSSIVTGNTGGEIYDVTEGSVIAGNDNIFGHSGISNVEAFEGFVPGDNDINATNDCDPNESNCVPTALSAILRPLADNGGPTMTHALVPGSPALDLDASCSALQEAGKELLDQRGESRPVGNGCDAGSFELSISPQDTRAFLPAIYSLLL